MRISGLGVFLTVIIGLQAISITVSSVKERCMIVSSNNAEQLLKVDLRFQRFSDQALEEGYRVVLHDTETHEEQAYQVSEGTFRKEFQLTQSRARPI
jgi:predicted deacetylase